jgi:hypothetical protein
LRIGRVDHCRIEVARQDGEQLDVLGHQDTGEACRIPDLISSYVRLIR